MVSDNSRKAHNSTTLHFEGDNTRLLFFTLLVGDIVVIADQLSKVGCTILTRTACRGLLHILVVDCVACTGTSSLAQEKKEPSCSRSTAKTLWHLAGTLGDEVFQSLQMPWKLGLLWLILAWSADQS